MRLKLNRQLTIFADGNHNAFTDICWFKGKPYCTFRHATNHMSEDGRVLVLRGTEEGDRWQVVASIRSVTDTRDPKLMVTPEGLFCYCFARWLGETPSQYHRASGHSFTEDGDNWTPWELIQYEDIYWRPRWYNGRAYVAAYRVTDWSVPFKTSPDGRTWEDLCLLTTREGDPRPNEVALDFAPDGTCWAMVRREYGEGHPLLARAQAPYTDWSYEEIDIKLQGMCLWFVGEQPFLSGRWYQPGGYVNTAIFRLDGTKPVCQAVLPSGGDTSYMGAAQHPDDPRRWWLSYYSSHEYNPRVNSQEHPANIYLVEAEFEG